MSGSVRPRVRAQQHDHYSTLHLSNHHSQRLPTEMQDKSSHWRRRRELDMGHGPWPPGRARALGAGVCCCSCDPRCSRPCAGGDRACVCSRAAVFLLVVAEAAPTCPKRAMRGLRRTLSPYRNPLGAGSVCLPSTPCRALPIIIITYSIVHSGLASPVPYIAPSTHHAPCRRQESRHHYYCL